MPTNRRDDKNDPDIEKTRCFLLMLLTFELVKTSSESSVIPSSIFFQIFTIYQLLDRIAAYKCVSQIPHDQSDERQTTRVIVKLIGSEHSSLSLSHWSLLRLLAMISLVFWGVYIGMVIGRIQTGILVVSDSLLGIFSDRRSNGIVCLFECDCISWRYPSCWCDGHFNKEWARGFFL